MEGGVAVNSVLQFNAAFEAVMIAVPAGYCWLERLAVCIVTVSWQRSSGAILTVVEYTLLFWRVDVVNNIQKHPKWPILPPLLHIEHLLALICSRVIVGVRVCAKHDSLADKIEYMAGTTEPSIAGAEAVHRAELVNSSIVVEGVVKYKVA